MKRLFLVCLASCFQPSPPSGLPCSADHACPEGQRCDLVTQLCDGSAVDPSERSWTDDTAADFEAGSYLAEVGIEAGGFVGPRGYLNGALRTTGYAGLLVGNPISHGFDEIAAMPAAGHGFSRGWRALYNSLAPFGVGLTAIDNVTVTLEGEIELPLAGSYEFFLFCDDIGFIEIAPPGGAFEPLLTDRLAGSTVTRTITEPGWYRFRGAFQDSGAGMHFNFEVDTPAPSDGRHAIEVDRMRVRADDLAGVVIDGFDDAQGVRYVGTSLTDTLDHAYGTDAFQLPIGTNSFTLRSSGQLRIDTEGDYAFDLDSVQGHRMWIDGQPVADAFSTSAEHTTTSPIHLVRGWHDLVIDVQKAGSVTPGSLALAVASGPVTGPLAADALRPVVARSQRFVAGQSSGALAVPDGGTATRTIFLRFPAEFTTEAIRYEVQVDHALLSQVGLVLDPPAGPSLTLAAPGSLADGPTSIVLADALPIDRAGGTWAFVATDSTVDMMTSSIVDVGVTHFGHGGVAPFATQARYESAVRELGAVSEFRELAWAVRQGPATAATLQLRTCDDAAGCAAEPWTDVALGTVPSVTARRFAQYGVTLTSDGDTAPALDVVELRYVVSP